MEFPALSIVLPSALTVPAATPSSTPCFLPRANMPYMMNITPMQTPQIIPITSPAIESFSGSGGGPTVRGL